MILVAGATGSLGGRITIDVPLSVNYLPLGGEIPLVPAAISALLNGMETFETFVDMTETALAYGVKLTTLDGFIRQMVARQ